MKVVGMIPARMGSQRLKKKNLRELGGSTLISRAIQKCVEANCFDEIYVNSENTIFQPIAETAGVNFYKRPDELGGNEATSEDFVTDFLNKIECDYLIQVHSIAPLLSISEIRDFTSAFVGSDYDVYLSCIEDRIEVAFQGQPVNFTFSKKTNSQELHPTQRLTWCITGWKRETFLNAKSNHQIGTYAGQIGFFPVSNLAGHVIKTEHDLKVAAALMETLG